MNCTMMFCSHVRFINSYTIKCMWDNLQLSGVFGITDAEFLVFH